jgi:hypothetical protein
MKGPETRTDVLATLFVEQALWEALLDDVGEARMDEPGVQGTWSVKEIAAHLTAWDEWIAGQLRAACRGEPYLPDEVASDEVNDVDERYVAAFRHRTAAEVRAESRGVFGEPVAAVEQMTDDELAERGRFPWAPDQTLAAGVASEFTDHYREHMDAVRAWLEASSRSEPTFRPPS